MEIVDKGSINDSEQKLFLWGLYKYYQIRFENSLFWELSSMEGVIQAKYSDELIS